jgi:photosystem II stability/assembly factor-like uncharacterized protein
MFRKNFLSMVLLLGMLISQSVPPALAATYCDHAQFVSDLTVPDGSSFGPGATFTKTWRLMNIGTCTWTTAYNLVWVGGEVLGAPLSLKLPADVPPGQVVDISINLTAPTTPANYKGFFKLSNSANVQFGIGDSANNPIWVDINVISVSGVIYDFVANAPYAQWKSGAGLLPFPGTSGDSRGFAFQVNNPHLEDDSLDTAPGLLTVPQNKFNGYIQATFPEFQVQQGDRLQTLVNCEFGATNCYVTFRIDYLLPNGAQRTLWSWKEAYDKRFYRADLDLNSLAGQKVRFVFMLLSSGFASSDRPIWGSPRIMRTGTTQPPGPPPTLTPLPPLPATPTPIGQPPPTIVPSGCDKATFVTDVTVPDGTIFSPGAAFTKTWRLKNAGSCPWTTAYKLIYYSGEQMGTSTAVNLPWNVSFDQTVDISVNLVAPSTTGKYRGFWILSNANGQFFGIGSGARDPIWVEINVAGQAPIASGYDFTSNICSAEWRSTVGVLPCPGTDGNSNGFVIKLDAPRMEDGSTGAPGLLTVPQNRYNGYIQGFFPTFTVQPGDRFKATVGCEFGAACYLTYRLDYMAPNGYIGTFWQWREQNEAKVYNADIDLGPLAGRSVRFILTILATGSATNDRALWGSPRIVRAGTTPVTNTPTPTFTPPPADWLTYTNTTYGFQFNYPPGSERFFETANNILIKLPITPGTNLREKYLQMTVRENVNPCQSPLSDTSRPGSPTETVVFNGISFFKQIGGDAGVGHLHEWVGYSTLKNNACISMDFVLHSLAAGNSDPPQTEFDKAAESAVFLQVMQTFSWLSPEITPTPTFTPSPTPTQTSLPPTANPQVVVSPHIRKLFMMDTSNGWAIGNSYVLRTGDGGTTIQSVISGFFRDANKGWVIATTLADVERTSLFRTADGGTTWTPYDVPFSDGYIQFLDDMNGFVLAGLPSGMQKHAVSLYQTSDGGATWTLKYAVDPSQPNNTLPFSGHKLGMAFRDTSTGWVGGDYPSPGYVYLYKTTNSGVSWSQQSLALPIGYESAYITIEAPKFFGSNDAILPVWMGTNTGRDLFIYVTHDGGNTWTRSTSVVPHGQNTDFISINNGFAWDTTGFFKVTQNSGGNWTQFTPNINFADDLPFMDFVSTTTGWVIQNAVNGVTPLYRTNDGGATWTLISGNAAPPTSTPTPTPTIPAAPSPAEFAQNVVNTLNARNFNALPAMMDQTFNFAYWQSQGNSYPSDQAIESLRTGLTVTLIPNAGMDLNSLLGGLNPYSIMGLDPARSYALFVSGWGSDSNAEAILYITQRGDGSLYWHSVLIAPTKFINQSTLTGPYAVVRVAFNDVLNIRSGAGVSNPVVGSFPPDSISVMRTGPTASADNAIWVQVQNPSGGTGWVNSYYLTEYVSHDAFCADTRIQTLIEQLKGSMNQSNGDMLAGIVSPAHGVDVRLWAYGPAANYSTTTARNVFTSLEVFAWGSGPAGGTEYGTGTFSQIIQPKVQEVLNAPNMETYCDNLTKVFPLSNPWPYPNIRYYNLYKPATDGVVFDFRTWLIGFEYIDGQPYLYSMVSIVWEP